MQRVCRMGRWRYPQKTPPRMLGSIAFDAALDNVTKGRPRRAALFIKRPSTPPLCVAHFLFLDNAVSNLSYTISGDDRTMSGRNGNSKRTS